MSLLSQCVNFQVSTMYSFVAASSLKGFWVHYMDKRTRLDGRGPYGPCWDLDVVDLAQSHRAKGTRHTIDCEHQQPNLMPGDKLKTKPKIFSCLWCFNCKGS